MLALAKYCQQKQHKKYRKKNSNDK